MGILWGYYGEGRNWSIVPAVGGSQCDALSSLSYAKLPQSVDMSDLRIGLCLPRERSKQGCGEGGRRYVEGRTIVPVQDWG